MERLTVIVVLDSSCSLHLCAGMISVSSKWNTQKTLAAPSNKQQLRTHGSVTSLPNLHQHISRPLLSRRCVLVESCTRVAFWRDRVLHASEPTACNLCELHPAPQGRHAHGTT